MGEAPGETSSCCATARGAAKANRTATRPETRKAEESFMCGSLMFRDKKRRREMKFSLCVPDNSPNSNRIQCKFWGNLESGPCTRPSTGICSPSFHLQIHNLRHLTHFQRRPRPPRRSPEIGPENAPLSGKKRRPKPGKHPFGAVLAPSRAQTNYLFVPFSSPGSLFRIRCPGVSRHRACGRRIATPVPRARSSRRPGRHAGSPASRFTAEHPFRYNAETISPSRHLPFPAA